MNNGFPSLNRLLDSFEEMGVPSFDIEVRHHGKKVFRRMYGYSDAEKKVPINGTERYYVYSCSKVITCAAALTLVEQKKLSLSDPLSDYLPEFARMKVRENGVLRAAKRPITIEHLFTMSAGFTYQLDSDGMRAGKIETHGCETREMMRYLAREPLIFDPGDRFQYSLCHDVLAAVVQVAAGERFGAYVKRAVFDPLGMTHSTYAPGEYRLEDLAAQYVYSAEDKTFRKYDKNVFILGPKYESGGAGCVSTVDDFMKFLEALRTGDSILSNETIELLSKNRLSPAQLATYDVNLTEKGYGYGLGYRCPLDDSSEASDIGWGGAAAAYLACDRKYDYAVYYAQHSLSSPNQLSRGQIPRCIREDLSDAE